MAITLAAQGFSTISLPGDLQLQGRLEWTGVAQQVTMSLEGAIIAQVSQQTDGQPLTLTSQPTNGSPIWVLESVIDAIRALASSPGLTITLTLESGAQYRVLFDQNAPVTVTPVRHRIPAHGTEQANAWRLHYYFTLKFFTVTA